MPQDLQSQHFLGEQKRSRVCKRCELKGRPCSTVQIQYCVGNFTKWAFFTAQQSTTWLSSSLLNSLSSSTKAFLGSFPGILAWIPCLIVFLVVCSCSSACLSICLSARHIAINTGYVGNSDRLFCCLSCLSVHIFLSLPTLSPQMRSLLSFRKKIPS